MQHPGLNLCFCLITFNFVGDDVKLEMERGKERGELVCVCVANDLDKCNAAGRSKNAAWRKEEE